MESSMMELEAVYGVPRLVGAREDDRERNEGAIDDERLLEWLCIVPGRLEDEETRGGRSRRDGGETLRL
jgi:hypothetical protein